jgi:hypothetical protein
MKFINKYINNPKFIFLPFFNPYAMELREG